jgi:hypothetical protein
MMSVDVGTTVERLLPRFEALRSGGSVKVLAISATADAVQSGELPLAYQEFAESPRTLGTRYGRHRKGANPVMCFRFLGMPADIDRFLRAAEASGNLLKGRLNQVHLVKDRKLPGAQGTASQARWLIASFSAAAGKQLQTDGLAGGDWYLWHRASGIVAAEGTVERYRGPGPAAAAPLAALVELAQSDEEPTAFAKLEDAAETSLALLHWLAERWEASPDENEIPEPKQNTCQLLEELCSTAEGLERVEAAWGQGGQQALARLVGKRSAGSVNRSKYFKSELLPKLEKLKAARAMQRDHNSRFREDAVGSIE